MPSLFPIKEGLFLNNKNQKEYNNQFSIIMLHSIYTQFLGFIQNYTESDTTEWLNWTWIFWIFLAIALVNMYFYKAFKMFFCCCLLTQSHPHWLLPCPLPTPGVYSNSCPSHWWCHPTISSSVIPFSSCLQSFPPSGSFPMSQFFASGGQSVEVSASACLCNENLGLISFRIDWLDLLTV